MKATSHLLSFLFSCTHIFIILICICDTFTDQFKCIDVDVVTNYLENSVIHLLEQNTFYWTQWQHNSIQKYGVAC
jgi:hypothetical protein